MDNTQLVLQLLILAVSKAESLGTLYSKARAENRTVSDEELESLGIKAGSSLRDLQDWIDSKK